MVPKENPTWVIIDSSKMQTYLECPRLYFYQYVLGWRSVFPNNHLVFGEAWHLPMEHLLLNGYSDDIVIEGYNLFENHYRKVFNPDTDEMFKSKTPANAFLALGLYASHMDYRRDLSKYEVLYTEIAGSVAISDSKLMYFRMDSILRNRMTDKKFSLEHKTGSRLWMWAEQWPLSIQTGTYTHVLHCLFPFGQVEGVTMNGTFFMNRKKDPIEFYRFPVGRTTDQMQVWLDTVNYYYEDIVRNMEMLSDAKEEDEVLFAFPLRPTSCLNYGRICAFNDYCNAWQNPLQKCFEPPLGFEIDFWNPMEREAKEIMNL